MKPTRATFAANRLTANETSPSINLTLPLRLVAVLRFAMGFSVAWVLAISGLASAAHACHPRTDPMTMLSIPSGPSRYEQIFVGTVVGVRLDQYIVERERVKNSGVEMISTDGSLPFSLEVYTEEVLKGEVEPLHRATFGGCIVVEPKVHDRIIVFIHLDGTAMFRPLKGVGGTVGDDDVERVRRCLSGDCDAGISP